MKFLIASVLVVAIFAASTVAFPPLDKTETVTITSMEPMQVQSFEGLEVEVVAVNVTVQDLTRFNRPRSTTFYATSLVEPFLSGFQFCKSRHWNLASPQSDLDQQALESVIAQAEFGGNTWLGSMCAVERWAWLSDGTWVTYNNFPSPGGLISRTPSCGNVTQVLMMFSPNVNNLGNFFKWGVEDMFQKNHVVCQASNGWRWRKNVDANILSISNTDGRPRPISNPLGPQRLSS